MIIKSKFRDIPVEEACKCYSDPLSAEGWAKLLTAPLLIETPASTAPFDGFKCNGPFFVAHVERGELVSFRPNVRIAVCPHIAEIGD